MSLSIQERIGCLPRKYCRYYDWFELPKPETTLSPRSSWKNAHRDQGGCCTHLPDHEWTYIRILFDQDGSLDALMVGKTFSITPQSRPKSLPRDSVSNRKQVEEADRSKPKNRWSVTSCKLAANTARMLLTAQPPRGIPGNTSETKRG